MISRRLNDSTGSSDGSDRIHEYFDVSSGKVVMRNIGYRKFWADLHETLLAQHFDGANSRFVDTERSGRCQVELPPAEMLVEHIVIQIVRGRAIALIADFPAQPIESFQPNDEQTQFVYSETFYYDPPPIDSN